MNRLVLFLFLLGSLFIFIGISNTNSSKIKGSKTFALPTFIKTHSSPTTSFAPVPSNSSLTPNPGLIQNLNERESQVLITRVVDGDTVDVQIDNKKDVVRLIGINAPETKECFGKEATDKASALLSSKIVNLEADSTQDDRDKYHRLLRYVFVDGTNFDELMVREGFAKEYTYHVPYKYQSLFKSAEKDARDNKRGMWADGACLNSSNVEQSPKSTSPNSSNQNFTCDCKKYCSQIATCEEAYFQLNNCGCTARDSDHDGIPCESLCK